MALLVPTAAFAQAATESPVQDPAEQTDLLDVWHQFRHKPTEPEKRPEAQGVMIAAISSSVNSVSYSTKHQTLVNVRFDVFTSENRWFVEGDNRFYESGQTVYGLGADTPSSAGVDATYDFFRLHDPGDRHLGLRLVSGRRVGTSIRIQALRLPTCLRRHGTRRLSSATARPTA